MCLPKRASYCKQAYTESLRRLFCFCSDYLYSQRMRRMLEISVAVGSNLELLFVCVCVLSLFVLIYKLPVFCHSLRVLVLVSFYRVPSLISSSVCLPLCLSAVLFMRRSTSTGWLSCWRSWGGMWGASEPQTHIYILLCYC